VALKDRITFLTSPTQVDDFLSQHAFAVIFKAGMCHRSDESFAEIVPLLDVREDVPFAVVRVVEARAASDHLGQRAGIRHESPQLLIFRDGRLVTSRNHRDITEAALAAALSGHLTAV